MMNYHDLDKKIRINFFSGHKKRNSKSNSLNICAYLGTLIYNGFNTLEDGRVHRIRCSKCEKRFGKDIEMRDLLLYQQRIKMILYELFVLKYPLTGIAKQWGIPLNPARDTSNKIIGIQGIVEDITERKKIEQKLIESEEQYRTMINSLADPLNVVEKDLKILFINPAFEHWLDDLGIEKDVVGRTVLEAFPFERSNSAKFKWNYKNIKNW